MISFTFLLGKYVMCKYVVNTVYNANSRLNSSPSFCSTDDVCPKYSRLDIWRKNSSGYSLADQKTQALSMGSTRKIINDLYNNPFLLIKFGVNSILL